MGEKIIRGFPCAKCGKEAGKPFGYGYNSWLKCTNCGYAVCGKCHNINKKSCPICSKRNKLNTMGLADG